MSEQRTEQREQGARSRVQGNGNGDLAGRAKVEWVDPMGLKNDRELDEWWPLGSVEEASEQAFIADIAERGVLCPLMVSPDGRIVWDGRRRLRAAKRFAEQLHQVPVIRCRDEDRTAVILAGVAHHRNMSQSAQVYITRRWWMPIAQAPKQMTRGGMKRVVTPLKPSIFASGINPNGSIGPLASMEDVATFMGIDRKVFFQCRQVMDLFEKREEVRDKWEPKLLSGEASFTTILRAVLGAAATAKNEGRRPEEFRDPAAEQAYRAVKLFPVRVKDFTTIGEADWKRIEDRLEGYCQTGPQKRSSEQMLEAVEASKRLTKALKTVAERLAEKEEE